MAAGFVSQSESVNMHNVHRKQRFAVSCSPSLFRSSPSWFPPALLLCIGSLTSTPATVAPPRRRNRVRDIDGAARPSTCSLLATRAAATLVARGREFRRERRSGRSERGWNDHESTVSTGTGRKRGERTTTFGNGLDTNGDRGVIHGFDRNDRDDDEFHGWALENGLDRRNEALRDTAQARAAEQSTPTHRTTPHEATPRHARPRQAPMERVCPVYVTERGRPAGTGVRMCGCVCVGV